MNKKIIIGVVLGVFLLLGLIGGLVVWFVFTLTAEPVNVVRAHLEAINQDDYARAYGYFSASLKDQHSLEEFQAFVEENRAALKSSDSTFSSRKIENEVCTLRGTLSGQQGRVTPVRYTLMKEGERWAISGFRLGGGDE